MEKIFTCPNENRNVAAPDGIRHRENKIEMKTEIEYQSFLEKKTHLAGSFGFDAQFMPEILFPFQKSLIEWATRKGRCAIFADCGLGKTFMQLTWAENVVRKTNKNVLLLTPLAVGAQTVFEADKIGVQAKRSHRGEMPSSPQVVIANYERLHYFNSEKFSGVVCDESSILKNFDGKIKAAITDFMRKLPYRLLCTATAAPNDYIELGTSSEALGDLGFMDMLGRFFKKAEVTLSRKDEHRSGIYRFRGHAERDFWRWVCSWARAVRRPSDMGFSDDGFKLPNLITREHVVQARTANPDFLFDMPAVGLAEQRAERSRTTKERCELAAELANSQPTSIVCWGYLNRECDLLEKLVQNCEQVSGDDPDEKKEEIFSAFASGQIKALITKPVIAGLGLNWQHCSRQTFFPSHSFEQWYQSIRRCWRFGQKNDVVIDVITSEGERNVLDSLNRKSESAEKMFANLINLMNNELAIEKKTKENKIKIEKPSWL